MTRLGFCHNCCQPSSPIYLLRGGVHSEQNWCTIHALRCVSYAECRLYFSAQTTTLSLFHSEEFNMHAFCIPIQHFRYALSLFVSFYDIHALPCLAAVRPHHICPGYICIASISCVSFTFLIVLPQMSYLTSPETTHHLHSTRRRLEIRHTQSAERQ